MTEIHVKFYLENFKVRDCLWGPRYGWEDNIKEGLS
jgi:hypothetical protein